MTLNSKKSDSPRETPHGRTGYDPISRCSSSIRGMDGQLVIEPTETSLPAKQTPLPYAPIIALSLGRIAEGLLYSVIFPYVNQLVSELGVPDKDVGKWSAAAEAVHFVTATFSGPLFGHLGDRFGRKPVYLLSTCGWMVGACVFGTTKSLPALILGRSILGSMAGPGVLSRTIMGEVTDQSNAVKAFAIFSPANSIGASLGPLVGGILAKPVPGLLSEQWTLFVKFPYLLPGLVVSFISGLVVLLAAIYVPETRPETLRQKYAGVTKSDDDRESAVPLIRREVIVEEGATQRASEESQQTTVSAPNNTFRSLFRHRPFQLMLLFFAVTSPNMMAFQTVFPLFAYTPPDLGGLGISVRMTGYILGAAAILGILTTVFAFPPLYARLGMTMCLLASEYSGSLSHGILSYAVAALLFPLIYRSHLRAEHSNSFSAYSFVLLMAHFALRAVGDFAGTLLDALLRPSLPSPDHLAMANASVYSIRQISRATGIYVVAFVFSLSARAASGSWGREMWWILFALANIPGLWLIRHRRKGQ